MLAVVRARNPLETMSWLRMLHLPPRCSSEFIKAFGIPGRISQPIFLVGRLSKSGVRANAGPPAVQKLKLWNDSLQMHVPEKCLRSPGPSPL
jgi:hypothetical protein